MPDIAPAGSVFNFWLWLSRSVAEGRILLREGRTFLLIFAFRQVYCSHVSGYDLANRMDVKVIGIAAALGSAAAWALGAILFKTLGERLSSPSMALVKSFISTILLGVVVLALGIESTTTETLLILLASGALGIAVGDTLFFAALKDLAPQTLVILLTSGQVLTVLLAIVFLGEAPAGQTWIGIALVVAGTGVVLRASMAGQTGKSQLRGIAFGFLSVVCMAVSMIIAKKGLKQVSAMEGTLIRMSGGVLTMFILGLFNRQLQSWVTPFRDKRLLVRFVGSVCVVTFGGFWLSLLAVKHLDVSVANTLNSTEPLFVLPLAAILLKEKISFTAVGGALGTVAGIALICTA